MGTSDYRHALREYFPVHRPVDLLRDLGADVPVQPRGTAVAPTLGAPPRPEWAEADALCAPRRPPPGRTRGRPLAARPDDALVEALGPRSPACPTTGAVGRPRQRCPEDPG